MKTVTLELTDTTYRQIEALMREYRLSESEVMLAITLTGLHDQYLPRMLDLTYRLTPNDGTK